MNRLPVLSNILTPTRLKTYRRCAREHHYEYELGIRAIAETEAIRFGRLMHEAIAAWWSATMNRLEAAVAALEAATPTPDPYEMQKARALLAGYHLRWSEQPFDVLAVNAEFRAPVVNPETDALSKTWILGGKINAIVRRRRDGWVSVVELRTTSEDISPGSEFRKRLQLDAQVGIYYAGAKTLGHTVTGCLYDLIRKPGLRPLRATPLESRRYTKEGRLYAGQRDRDETPAEYGARVTEDIVADPGNYFERHEVMRPATEIREQHADTWELGREIREAALAERAPRNPDGCVRYGYTCEYFPVCTGLLSLDDTNRFRRVENVHPELTAGFEIARKEA